MKQLAIIAKIVNNISILNNRIGIPIIIEVSIV